jgi:ketosteroid isomerase-like protein
MKTWFASAALVLTTALPALAQRGPASIIVAEREFAQAAQQTTTKQAFLAYMADSAIIFANGKPVLAKPAWQKRPEPANAPKLIWGPSFASLAASGELGYTTGPWFVQPAGGKPTAHGQFFTLWSLQPDGHFKFMLDVGISHAAPARQETSTEIVTPPARTGRAAKTTRAKLLALDEQLSEAVVTQGNGAGYAAWLSTQARLLRENHPPFTALAAIMPLLATEPARRFVPQGGQVARSGDMGYSYGTFTAQNPPGQGGYVHVWQQEAGRWRLVAEVLNPTNPKP